MIITKSILYLIVLIGIVVADEECSKPPDVQMADCTSRCLYKAGHAAWPQWSQDPKSDDFGTSMSFMCRTEYREYKTFNDQLRPCLQGCPVENIQNFDKVYSQHCQWFYKNQSKDCVKSSASQIISNNNYFLVGALGVAAMTLL